MEYQRIFKGRFIDRPNRFIAHIEIDGKEEVVHVKNTGRCAELLRPDAEVYVQKAANPERKTQWDLIAVKKGERLINMDSQIPNAAVKEWVEKEEYFKDLHLVRPETTYGNSRIDLYLEYGEEKKAFIEVKGVTLENDDIVAFPDAPSERAVKHVEELIKAVKEGYEAYIFFVIQMENVSFFTPNRATHPEFADVLIKAQEKGVKILAYDCVVTKDSMVINRPVPVILRRPELHKMPDLIVKWFRDNKRDLPWRKNITAYRVWLSEIMLQQTRVEAVKPYFERFLTTLPTVADLAEAKEDVILKLWEGLGYYNRVRNMQKAAQVVVDEYHGAFPEHYEEIRKLPGIGNYTAGAISSFVYGECKPAVDGNVLRVITRVLAMDDDIMKASVRTEIEKILEEIIPRGASSDFNQGLIELGAIVCLPNGEPLCDRCPLKEICKAGKDGIWTEYPVKKKPAKRRIENRTVLLLWDENKIGIRKRPGKGLLAGMYEFPNIEGKKTDDEVIEYCKEIGLMPLHVKKLEDAKHIFSHVEWKMNGYSVRVDELEKNCADEMIFTDRKDLQEKYAIPSAFEAYTKYVKQKME